MPRPAGAPSGTRAAGPGGPGAAGGSGADASLRPRSRAPLRVREMAIPAAPAAGGRAPRTGPLVSRLRGPGGAAAWAWEKKQVLLLVRFLFTSRFCLRASILQEASKCIPSPCPKRNSYFFLEEPDSQAAPPTATRKPRAVGITHTCVRFMPTAYTPARYSYIHTPCARDPGGEQTAPAGKKTGVREAGHV